MKKINGGPIPEPNKPTCKLAKAAYLYSQQDETDEGDDPLTFILRELGYPVLTEPLQRSRLDSRFRSLRLSDRLQITSATPKTSDPEHHSTDAERISLRLLSLFPQLQSAVLVGSAVNPRGLPPKDLDVIAFDWSVPEGSERISTIDVADVPTHVVFYHPWHFFALLEDPDLTILYLREIRKLIQGRVLLDSTHSTFELLIERLAHLYVPRGFLQQFVDAASILRLAEAGLPRLDFYFAVENLAFAYFHLNFRHSYSKPKWILRDARSLPTDGLFNLLQESATEFLQREDLNRVSREIRQQAQLLTCPARIVDFSLADAEFLINNDRRLDAVAPLRMALYRFARWLAAAWQLQYDDLRSISVVLTEAKGQCETLVNIYRKVFLLDVPIKETLREKSAIALDEFLTLWSVYPGSAY